MIEAKLIKASRVSLGDIIITLQVTMPRIILAEFNTHRMFSRNSASSRAIPFLQNLQNVIDNPFVPLSFQTHHKGMQGTDYLEGDAEEKARQSWLAARDAAIDSARRLYNENSVTKQLCNRILEPYMWHTVIVTATDWDNFFALRDHPAAEIHMQAVAKAMRQEVERARESTANSTKFGPWIEFGHWHLPYVNDDECDLDLDTRLALSVVRCARVSYLRQDAELTVETARARCNELRDAGHMSPFEHQAKAVIASEYVRSNFRCPWKQYRKFFRNENLEKVV